MCGRCVQHQKTRGLCAKAPGDYSIKLDKTSTADQYEPVAQKAGGQLIGMELLRPDDL